MGLFPMKSIDNWTIAEKLLSLQLKWIAAADAKVSPVFAINAAMLGTLAALAPPASQWTIGAGITAGIATLTLVGSILCLAQATFPRLIGPEGSLLFFGGITSMSESDYINRILSCTDDTLINDFHRQVYRNAQIASEKFQLVKWAMVFSFISLPFWLIALWLVYL